MRQFTLRQIVWVISIFGLGSLAIILGAQRTFAERGEPPPTAVSTSPRVTTTPAKVGDKPSVYCGAYGFVTYPAPPSLEMLPWVSHQIVTGTVVEQSEPYWDAPTMTGPDVETEVGGSLRTIATDYTIRVDQRLRGEDIATVTVARAGGTIDDCSMAYADEVPFQVGERVLLFLAEPLGDSTGKYVLATPLGHWAFIDDQTVVPARALELLRERPDEIPKDVLPQIMLPYDEFAGRLLASLRSGAPPEGEYAGGLEVVSLKDAPIQLDTAP